jgi:hypothetical protein
MATSEYSTIHIESFSQMSKRDIQASAIKLANEVLEFGQTNPLDRFIQLKRVAEYVDAYAGVFKQSAITEAEKYGKSTTVYGAKIELRNSGDRFDYEADPVYCELSEKLKARKELLDLARKSKDVIYDSEGVDVPRIPIKTHGGQTIAISF